MAIERTAQNVDFGSAPQAGAVPMNVGNAPVDINKFTDASRANAPVNGLLDNLLGAVLPAVQKLGTQELQTGREEAYLRGQAAAGAGLAQDQVDSNILTRDWATAGYRDTRGRLAQADAEAQTGVDMQKLREQSPEDFQKYLADRRQKLMPSLEGMSLDARKNFLTQQLTSDRAAIAKHAGEHQKFIIDQLGTAIQTDMSVRIDGMTNAKTDPAAYLTQADNAYAGVYGNIWNNPNLPKANKLQLTEQAATLALASNHQVLYEKMRDTKVPGTDHSMLDELPFDSQVKLAKGYQQSLTDTAAMRLGNFAQQWGLMTADFGNPLKPPLSYTDFSAMRDQAVQNGFLKTPEAIASAEKAWADGNEKKLATGQLAANFATGNIQGIFGAGKTSSDAYTAWIQTQARNGVSVADTAGQLLQIGVNTGQQEAFKGVGELTRSSVAMIGNGQTIDPSQLQMLNTVLGTLDKAQESGNANAMSSFLSSYGDADRAKIMLYRENLARTGNPVISASNAADAIAKSSSLTETERNVQAQSQAQENQKILDAMEPKGLWGMVKDAVIPDAFRPAGGANVSKVSSQGHWFESEERVQQAMAPSKVAMQEELNYIGRAHPELSGDARARMAYAAVADRTIVLDGGPLVTPHLPSGTSIQQFFGVAQNIRTDVIGSAIDDLHPAGKGNRTVYKIDGQARLQWQELNSSGAFVRGGTVDPKSVAGAVQDKQDALTDKFQATDGRGITVKGVSGMSVNFNGNNTAGAHNEDMLDFRKNLVKFEDVRDTPYKDSVGVSTVGVGVSEKNPHFPKPEADGKVKQEAINQSFMRASNDAAVAARGGQARLGLPSSDAFKLLAEMSYQGGGSFYNTPANKPYVQALKEHNLDAAITALKDTSQYKVSGDDRRKHYEDLTRKALGSSAVATNQTNNPFQ